MLVEKTVTHALVADDHLRRAEENHDPFDQAGAGENHIRPFGFQTGNLFALGDILVEEKSRLPSYVPRVPVLQHRATLIGEVADGIVLVGATGPALAGVEGDRGVGKLV